MYPDLRTFVHALDTSGELLRIAAPVSPVLDIAAFADLVSKAAAPCLPSPAAQCNDPRFFHRGGPALLFESVQGSGFPVLINAYGSYRRMEMALGCDASGSRQPSHRGAGERGSSGFESIASRIAELVKPQPPRTLGEALHKARQFAPLLRIGPKRVRRGDCQEVVLEGDAVDLTILPLLRCWPLDGDFAVLGYPRDTNAGVPGLGHPDIDPETWDRMYRGRYITFGGIHTIHADDRDAPRPASHNIGMYRVQLLGKRTMAMHWHMHHDGASHWRSWKKLGRPMPVAIALGGESVLPYAATCPLPPGISELHMAGFLNRRGIRMVRARTVPLWVPANAEIVIEGFVSHESGIIGWDPCDPNAGPLGPGAVFEGPFGDHTGFYSLPDRYPLLTVTAITHRRDAIYPTTIVGLPPQEDYYLGKATERIMFPLLKTIIHDIDDYDLPQFGAFHNCACVRITKSYPMQARRVMHSIWGAGQMAWTKCLFVVDDSVNVHDTPAVLRAAARFCRPDRDLERVHGPLDILDHAAPRLGAGSKIGFDCTPKRDGEQIAGLDLTPPWEPPPPEVRKALVSRVCALSGVIAAAWPEELAGWLFVQIDMQPPAEWNGGMPALPEAVPTKRNAGAPSSPSGRTSGGTAASGSAERHARMVGRAVLELPDCPPFVIVVGPHADITDPDSVLFHWCANFDPGRDAIVFGHRIAFDAAPKTAGEVINGEPVRSWPPLISMDPVATERIRPLLDGVRRA
ncbi:MAG: UbiD family decarboxylase [Phycisphaeraceae bacterium]|nr:UbiD family decarboxylase [Phycisphaeraceae bacterium]MCW5755206.1 UbiD family decarboxylase [Phycisphaeraceae bacterium]